MTARSTHVFFGTRRVDRYQKFNNSAICLEAAFFFDHEAKRKARREGGRLRILAGKIDQGTFA